MIRNIILPELLFKTKPVPLQFNDLISIQKALALFPSTYKQNNLEWILFWGNRLSSSSECLLKMQTVNSSETQLPRPHVILTYTTLCLFTNLKTWSKKPSGWFMQEKLNYKHHSMFWTNDARCNVAALCTTAELLYLLPCQMKQQSTVEPWIASIIRSRNVLVIQNTRISKWIFP